MKKIFILVFFLFFPIFVFAKEDCTVVSGNGRNIGDEIKCGTESFYIVSVDLDNVYMLSKYNLFVGDKIDFISLPSKIKLDLGTYNNWYGEVPDEYYDDCFDYALEKGYDPYFVYPMTDSSRYYDLGEVYITGCRVYEELEYEKIRQDERAVGTKLDGNGKSILPLYGITYMDPYYGYDAIHDGYLEENEYDENGDLILNDGSSFKYYLDGYKDELINQGINVKDVSFLKLSNALNLLENVSGKSIDVNLVGFYYIFKDHPYVGNYDFDKSYKFDNPLFYTTLMDISEYIDEDHKWISSSTYWLGSGYDGEEWGINLFEYNDFYISNEGMLCAIARGGQCGYLNYPIGNGLRTMVTVSKNDIAYNIDVVTNGNGNIEVIDSAAGGDKIEFKVTSKKGYKLTKLVVISSSGEKVQFTEGDVVVSEDGIATIDKNVFTMPYDCVVIQAEWSVINPNTVSYILTAMFILSIFGGLVYYLKNKRKVQVYQQCNEE